MLVQKILSTQDVNEGDDNEQTTKQKVKTERNNLYETLLDQLRDEMNHQEKRQNEANREAGSYNWLTTLPLKEYDYNLNKEEFWDALRIRYDWSIPRLPSECACGYKFDLSHALSCKKGGFIAIRHNEVRDITALLLSEVCKHVRKEAMLMELNGECLQERSASTGKESRLDASALGFWGTDQRAFCDARCSEVSELRNQEMLPEEQ